MTSWPRRLLPGSLVLIHKNGDLCVPTYPKGMEPGFESIIPAPMMDAAERRRRIAHARDEIALNGMIVIKEARQRNAVFDKKGERTSTVLVARACRTDAEAAEVAEQIRHIMAACAPKGGA